MHFVNAIPRLLGWYPQMFVLRISWSWHPGVKTSKNFIKGDQKVSMHAIFSCGAMKTQCIRTIPTQFMIWSRLSKNTLAMRTVLYWTWSWRTQFGVSINIWRLAGVTLNVTCNFLYCNQVHRDFLITLYVRMIVLFYVHLLVNLITYCGALRTIWLPLLIQFLEFLERLYYILNIYSRNPTSLFGTPGIFSAVLL
jgi:hypothetical protein